MVQLLTDGKDSMLGQLLRLQIFFNCSAEVALVKRIRQILEPQNLLFCLLLRVHSIFYYYTEEVLPDLVLSRKSQNRENSGCLRSPSRAGVTINRNISDGLSWLISYSDTQYLSVLETHYSLLSIVLLILPLSAFYYHPF